MVDLPSEEVKASNAGFARCEELLLTLPADSELRAALQEPQP